MRPLTGFILTFVLMCGATTRVVAQAAESIWLAASTTSYKAGDIVTITVNARSATPIQGFTFQIRYDPGCLKPIHAASPIPGMSGLQLPQTAGLVDASFASTKPKTADGVLAQVQFQSLASCQTQLVLESAALAIRNQSGFAAPLNGIATGDKSVALNIGAGAGAPQATQPLVGTPLPLGVESASQPNLVMWALITLLVMLAIGAALFWLLGLSRKGSSS